MTAMLAFVALLGCAEAGNYDAYLEQLALRNEEAHELFRREHLSGSYVLDYVMGSPDFRQTHPLLREYDNAEEADGTFT